MLPTLSGTLFLLFRAAPVLASTTLAIQVLVAAVSGLLLVTISRFLTAADEASSGASSVTSLWPGLAVLAAMFTAVTLAGYLQNSLRVLLTERTTWYTSERLLDVATAADVAHFDQPDFHDRLTRARAASTRPALITQNLLGFVGSVSMMVSLGGVLFTVHPLLVPVLAVMVVPLLGARSGFSRRIHRLATAFAEKDRRRAYIQGLMTNRGSATEVRAYGLTGYLRQRNQRLYEERSSRLRSLVWCSFPGFVMGGLATTALLVVSIGWLAALVLLGRLPVTDATVGSVTILQFSGTLTALAISANQLYESALYISDFQAFQAMLPDLLRARTRTSTAGVTAPYDFEVITVEDITFGYPGANQPALHGVSLHLRRNELVALVGANGSGKTTLAKLLCNLYQPQQGRIAWDGLDVSLVHPDQLRESVAVLFQDFGRYQFTVAENIGMGRVGNMADRTAVGLAADRARADEFIRALPAGYDALLGKVFSGGVDLSGGQWQRIALARAFFRAAPLVVLDEPTAALDPSAEHELYQGMRELFLGRTVLLISHRLASVRFADRIYVLDKGRVVEYGTHEDLMARKGVYARLYQLQESAQAGALTARLPVDPAAAPP